jgi:type IV fimbrial biogenesis protein FimT
VLIPRQTQRPAKPRTQRGFSLLEMMIGLVIFAILVASGAPSFSAWLSNTQIRTGADAIQNGLQLARAEAVRRNTQVFFSLTDSLSNSCALSTTVSNWVVSLTDPTGHCSDTPLTGAVQIVQIRSASETSKIVLTANQSQVSFNGLGRPNTAANICVGIAADSGACTGVEPEHRLMITVSAGGQIRTCNPTLANTDPQGCS